MKRRTHGQEELGGNKKSKNLLVLHGNYENKVFSSMYFFIFASKEHVYTVRVVTTSKTQVIVIILYNVQPDNPDYRTTIALTAALKVQRYLVFFHLVSLGESKTGTETKINIYTAKSFNKGCLGKMELIVKIKEVSTNNKQF